MKIRKISTIIAIAGLIALIGSTGESKTYSNVELLATKSASYGCVINGNNQLIIKNKNGDLEGYTSVGQMLNLGQSSKGETFVKVQETGVEGYLDNSDILDISSGINSKFQDLNLYGKTINISSKVNLRTEPSMDGNIIDKLNNNMSVKIIGKQGQWYKVSISNKIGYIFDEYIGILKERKNPETNTTLGITSQNNDVIKNVSSSNKIFNNSIIAPNTVSKVSHSVDAVSQKTVKEVSNQRDNKASDVKQISGIDSNVEKAQKADNQTATTTENTHKKESEKIPVSTNKSKQDSNKTVVKNSEKKDSNKKQVVEPKKEEGTKSNKTSSKDKNTGVNKVSKNQSTSASNVNKEKNTDSSKMSKNTNKTREMNKLPNVPLQNWETGFNTVQNKMNAQDLNGVSIMNIYTPENPAGYIGGKVYVRFANTNEICSGNLISLITPDGATNSNYGYLYEIPLYYKNVYKGTLYYGVNTFGDIQNGGYMAAGTTKPIQLTLQPGYWTIPNVGDATGFQNLCYFVNGVAQKGFQNIENHTYYFGENGQLYLGTHIIDGTKYVFSEEGYLISG